jgi:hypothetical protein
MLVEVWRQGLELPEEVLTEVILDAEQLIFKHGYECFFYYLTEEKGYRYFYGGMPLVGGNADLFSESWAWFKIQQEKLVQKNFALTEWEVEEFLESFTVLDPEARIKSLTFHLEIREKAKNRGEEIPFGLWPGDE